MQNPKLPPKLSFHWRFFRRFYLNSMNSSFLCFWLTGTTDWNKSCFPGNFQSLLFITKRAFRNETFLYSITTPLPREDFFSYPSQAQCLSPEKWQQNEHLHCTGDVPGTAEEYPCLEQEEKWTNVTWDLIPLYLLRYSLQPTKNVPSSLILLPTHP